MILSEATTLNPWLALPISQTTSFSSLWKVLIEYLTIHIPHLHHLPLRLLSWKAKCNPFWRQDAPHLCSAWNTLSFQPLYAFGTQRARRSTTRSLLSSPSEYQPTLKPPSLDKKDINEHCNINNLSHVFFLVKSFCLEQLLCLSTQIIYVEIGVEWCPCMLCDIFTFTSHLNCGARNTVHRAWAQECRDVFRLINTMCRWDIILVGEAIWVDSLQSNTWYWHLQYLAGVQIKHLLRLSSHKINVANECW